MLVELTAAVLERKIEIYTIDAVTVARSGCVRNGAAAPCSGTSTCRRETSSRSRSEAASGR